MEKLHRRRVGVVLAGLMAVGGALAGASFATGLVGGTDPIVACAQKESGQLRRVADAGECRASEQPLTWNLQGPAGAPGPAGSALVERWSLATPVEVDGRETVTIASVSWEQQTDALNVVYASVDVQAPTICFDMGSPDPAAFFDVDLVLDGELVAHQNLMASVGEQATSRLSTHVNSDSSGAHTAELRIRNSCERPEDVATVTRAAIDITGAS